MTRYEVELTDDQAQRLSLDWPPGRVPANLGSQACSALADAIRANPPKPPRMTEPGWGEKVIAHTVNYRHRRPFLRWDTCGSGDWTPGNGAHFDWSVLVDPEPVDSAR